MSADAGVQPSWMIVRVSIGVRWRCVTGGRRGSSLRAGAPRARLRCLPCSTGSEETLTRSGVSVRLRTLDIERAAARQEDRSFESVDSGQSYPDRIRIASQGTHRKVEMQRRMKGYRAIRTCSTASWPIRRRLSRWTTAALCTPTFRGWLVKGKPLLNRSNHWTEKSMKSYLEVEI